MNIPWGRLLIMSFFIYLFFVFMALVYAKKVMFPVPTPSYEKSENINLLPLGNGLEIAISRTGYLKNPQITILYSHGNGEDLGNLGILFDKFAEKQWEFIAYDYPGYGISTGNPSEQGCYQAIEATYKYATETLGRPASKVVLWGRSLGTGPSCYLAARKEIGGLLLETPFLSAFRTITEIPILPWDYFPNLTFSKSITCPSLIIHGAWDEIVPFRQGKKLHLALPQPKSFLEIKEGYHNNLSDAGGLKYKESIIDFIDSLATS